MSTLADSFLEDLEELGEDSDIENSNDDKDEERERERELNHEMEIDEEEKDDPGQDDQTTTTTTNTTSMKPQHSSSRLHTVAVLRQTPNYAQHMKKVREENVDNEYETMVASNDLMVRIDDEIHAIHRLVVDVYSKKFPELESLVPNLMDYIRVIQIIGNETDMTKVNLAAILPSATVMGVSVTGSSTSGESLNASDLKTVLDGCKETLELDQDKNTLLKYVETRMFKMAPNISAILGTRIAAQLLGRAGGLAALSRTPACNIQVMGQRKHTLSGFSSAAALKHTGLIYFSELVQNAPPFLRTRAARAVAGKVTLAARVDHQLNSHGAAGTSDETSKQLGLTLREELEMKIIKWQEPQKGRTKKALAIPDEKPRRKRGGKRYRKMKERMQMTEVRKEANRQSFATADNEYGDNAMGITYGRLGQEGSGNLRVVRKEQKQMAKKLKAASFASQSTSGLATSLAFTPVQGLELMNPEAAQERVRKANEKYFGTGTFKKVEKKQVS